MHPRRPANPDSSLGRSCPAPCHGVAIHALPIPPHVQFRPTGVQPPLWPPTFARHFDTVFLTGTRQRPPRGEANGPGARGCRACRRDAGSACRWPVPLLSCCSTLLRWRSMTTARAPPHRFCVGVAGWPCGACSAAGTTFLGRLRILSSGCLPSSPGCVGRPRPARSGLSCALVPP